MDTELDKNSWNDKINDSHTARGVQLNRKPCQFCGRKFVPESLSKHEPACRKTQLNAKKRKAFDSSKQRATEDLSVGKIKQAQKKAVAPPKSNWRFKHQDFIATIRAARGVQVALDSGGPLPPPPPPSINPDYIQCPYCSRRFNEKAAERHMNFCKEQTQRLPKKTVPDPNAKAKQAARTQYQAPRPKAKTTPGSQTSGYSPAASSSSSSRGARTTPSSTNISPAARQGIGRTPPGASNGQSRQMGSGTRGRSTGTTNQYSEEACYVIQTKKNLVHKHVDSPYPVIRTPGQLIILRRDYSSVTRDNLESPNGYQDNMVGLGKALRTGRDATAYHEARRNVKPTGNAHLKQTSNSNNMRGAIRGTNSSPLSGDQSYSHPSYREESDYYSSSSETDYYSHGYSAGNNPVKGGYKIGGGTGGGGVGGGKFCHECGTKYPVSNAKFCCECGVRRMMVS